jgi:hypothetical protein
MMPKIKRATAPGPRRRDETNTLSTHPLLLSHAANNPKRTPSSLEEEEGLAF